MFGGEAQLTLRAEHPFGTNPADDRCLQRRLLAEFRADARERGRHPGLHVWRAAHDGEFLGSAVDLAEMKAVGIRMLLDIEHARDGDAVEARREPLDILDFEARDAETARDFLDARIDSDELAQPLERKFHCAPPLRAGNWLRKRMSFSMNSRMSFTPSFSSAGRSTPIPNANPW